MTKWHRYRNGYRIPISGKINRIRSNAHHRPTNATSRQVVLHDSQDVGVRGTLHNGCSRAFTRGIGDDLLDHDHSAKLDHSQNEEKEQRCDDSKLDDGHTCPMRRPTVRNPPQS